MSARGGLGSAHRMLGMSAKDIWPSVRASRDLAEPRSEPCFRGTPSGGHPEMGEGQMLNKPGGCMFKPGNHVMETLNREFRHQRNALARKRHDSV